MVDDHIQLNSHSDFVRYQPISMFLLILHHKQRYSFTNNTIQEPSNTNNESVAIFPDKTKRYDQGY